VQTRAREGGGVGASVTYSKGLTQLMPAACVKGGWGGGKMLEHLIRGWWMKGVCGKGEERRGVERRAACRAIMHLAIM